MTFQAALTPAELLSDTATSPTRIKIGNFAVSHIGDTLTDATSRADRPLLVDGFHLVTDAVLDAARSGRLVATFFHPHPDPQRDMVPVRETFVASEWFIKPNYASEQSLSTLTEELPYRGPLATLTPEPSDIVAAWINLAMQDTPVVFRRNLGSGSILYFGLSLSDIQGALNPVGSLVNLLLAPRASAIGMPRTHGVGVVGYGPYGGMGFFHGQASNATEGLRFVAAIDPDPQRRKQAELDFPGIATLASIDEITANDEIDIAIIATPPRTHFSIAKDLLLKQKHVVIEKPMCLSVAEADELIALADTVGRVLTVNQNRRWDQDFRAIQSAIANGDLGEVFNIETFVGGFDHPCRAWHSDETVSGGIAFDWGAHHIDWILQLYEEYPLALSTQAHKRKWFEVTNLDQIRIHMEFEGGREATFYQSELAGFRRPKFYIQGTDATLIGNYRPITTESVDPYRGYERVDHHHAEAPAQLEIARYVGPQGLSVSSIPLAEVDRFGLHKNLADHLNYGIALEVNPRDVREVVRILEESHRQSKSYVYGRPS